MASASEHRPHNGLVEGTSVLGTAALVPLFAVLPQGQRHYLPRLIAYTLAHPDDAAMVGEALGRALRPRTAIRPGWPRSRASRRQW